MTIQTSTSQTKYTGNGVTKVFGTGFYFLLDTDLVIIEKTGTTTVALLLNVDYTVTGAGVPTGGAITRTVAPAVGAILTIARVVPVTQLTDYIQDDPFPAESHEKALDKLTMICQQLQTNINNAVLASTTQGEANTASNLGGGIGIFKQKSVLDLQFRSISSPGNGRVGIALVADRVEIDVSGIIHQANNWDGGQQLLVYSIPLNPTATDHIGWGAYLHNRVGTYNPDNMVALSGHVYHDGNYDNAVGGAWGITTEVWTNPLASTTAVGGELSVIAQCPTHSYPSIGANLVFKNHADLTSHPIASVGSGTYYNQLANALYITSQSRPFGSGAAWAAVGSGWNVAIKIGDPVYGSGLDWEGGDSGTGVKRYSTIMDLTHAGIDLAGGWPWLFLWQTGLTFFGCRFNAQVTTGAIEKTKLVSGGSGYNNGDVGTIAGGTGGTYIITSNAGNVVTGYTITAPGTLYYVGTPIATTATSGGGTGFTMNVQQVLGERLEFYRMTDPSDPVGTGIRLGFVDLSWNPAVTDGGSFLRAFDV